MIKGEFVGQTAVALFVVSGNHPAGFSTRRSCRLVRSLVRWSGRSEETPSGPGKYAGFKLKIDSPTFLLSVLTARVSCTISDLGRVCYVLKS
jgi:hypothetical protein